MADRQQKTFPRASVKFILRASWVSSTRKFSVPCSSGRIPGKQIANGSWTENETTGTGFPKVFYLKYDIYRNAWLLLAFATCQKLQKFQ